MAYRCLFHYFYINALALRHHLPDNKKGDTKPEMDNSIISCSNNNRSSILFHYHNYCESFGYYITDLPEKWDMALDFL